MITKGIQSELNKYLKSKFTPEEIDDMAWYTDLDSENTYTWSFELNNKPHVLVYSKKTKKVHHIPS